MSFAAAAIKNRVVGKGGLEDMIKARIAGARGIEPTRPAFERVSPVEMDLEAEDEERRARLDLLRTILRS